MRVLRKESGGPASPAQPTSSLIRYRRYRAEIQKLIAATALAASSLYTRNLDDLRGIEHLLTTRWHPTRRVRLFGDIDRTPNGQAAAPGSDTLT